MSRGEALIWWSIKYGAGPCTVPANTPALDALYIQVVDLLLDRANYQQNPYLDVLETNDRDTEYGISAKVIINTRGMNRLRKLGGS